MKTFVNEKMQLNKFRNVFIPTNKELYLTFKPKDNSDGYYGDSDVSYNMSKTQLYQSAIDFQIADNRRLAAEKAKNESEQKKLDSTEEKTE